MDLPGKQLGKIGPIRKSRTTEVEREATEEHTPARKPAKSKLRVAAKKSAVKKVPKFLCSTHKIAMVFSSELGHWYCPEQGCTHTRKAQVGGDADSVTKIKGAPKVVCKYDVDGDPTYYLFYEDEDLMIDLPFGAVVGHTVFSRKYPPSVVINVKSEDFVFLDKDGNTIPTSEVIDR